MLCGSFFTHSSLTLIKFDSSILYSCWRILERSTLNVALIGNPVSCVICRSRRWEVGIDMNSKEINWLERVVFTKSEMWEGSESCSHIVNSLMIVNSSTVFIIRRVQYSQVGISKKQIIKTYSLTLVCRDRSLPIMLFDLERDDEMLPVRSRVDASSRATPPIKVGCVIMGS